MLDFMLPLAAQLRAGATTPDDLAADGVALLLAAALPGPDDAALRADLVRAAAPWTLATMRSEAAVLDATAALTAAGVRHVVLKGPVLARAWPAAFGADARTFTDVDVLVAPDEVQRATEVLVRDLEATPGARSVGELAISLPSGATVDLHWLALNEARRSRRHRMDAAALLDDAVADDGLPRLGDGDGLVHVVLHALMSDASRLAAALDVAALVIGRPVDAGVALAAARRHRAVLPLAVMIDRAAGLTGHAAVRELAAAMPGSPWRSLCRGAATTGRAATGRAWSGGELLRSTWPTAAESFASLAVRTPTNVRTQLALRREEPVSSDPA